MQSKQTQYYEYETYIYSKIPTVDVALGPRITICSRTEENNVGRMHGSRSQYSIEDAEVKMHIYMVLKKEVSGQDPQS